MPVCPSLSICPSVRSSLNFLKIGPLVFSDIVHDDRWYLVINAAKFLKKKTGCPNQTQSKVFAIFLSLDQTFSWKLHRVIACNNASHLVEEKSVKKNWGPKIWSENKFFTIFSILVHNVVGFSPSIFSNLHHQFSMLSNKIVAWGNVQHPAELKPPEKHFPHKWGPKKPKSGPHWGFPGFTFFCLKRKDLIKLIFTYSLRLGSMLGSIYRNSMFSWLHIIFFS